MTPAELEAYVAKHYAEYRKRHPGWMPAKASAPESKADEFTRIMNHTPRVTPPKPKRQRKESNLVEQLLKRAGQLGMKLWRNQVGTYKLADGRYISSGLCVGSSDLIGYIPVVITPEMLGKTIAVFVAVEAKSPTGRASQRQLDFINHIVESGGVAVIATAPEAIDQMHSGAKHLLK